jgi:hypothetical protein
MNRRGFISLLAGAAGAPLVPWRGLVERVIVLAPAFTMVQISGLQACELGVPSDWIEGPISVNTDHAMIRSDRLELMQRLYADGTYQRYSGFTGYEETRREIQLEADRQHSPSIIALVERRLQEATDTWRKISDGTLIGSLGTINGRQS